MGAASFRWILQLHKDVPKAAKLYSEGLDFSINVCTLRWAELQSGSLKLALLHSPSTSKSEATIVASWFTLKATLKLFLVTSQSTSKSWTLEAPLLPNRTASLAIVSPLSISSTNPIRFIGILGTASLARSLMVDVISNPLP
ncbi:hypothetical protein TEA_028443 [Camellia sinensis var. sinensis]|uniref:Uncharacterized protein n=1 Tax=Camellia sinensis var. sinensis TaxID=542762 RepID=A0A4S4CVP9_CAMSN|nr:hypothetical protein TEA_028443 [Camellia sinensis var. sinensis]